MYIYAHTFICTYMYVLYFDGILIAVSNFLIACRVQIMHWSVLIRAGGSKCKHIYLYVHYALDYIYIFMHILVEEFMYM
jgi:hypothetical protein